MRSSDDTIRALLNISKTRAPTFMIWGGGAKFDCTDFEGAEFERAWATHPPTP